MEWFMLFPVCQSEFRLFIRLSYGLSTKLRLGLETLDLFKQGVKRLAFKKILLPVGVVEGSVRDYAYKTFRVYRAHGIHQHVHALYGQFIVCCLVHLASIMHEIRICRQSSNGRL